MIRNGRAVALGFFDGLHLGHRKLIEETVTLAEVYKLSPAVISFDVHPEQLVSGMDCGLITGIEERKALLSRVFGVAEMILLHFDEALRCMPWEMFLDELCMRWQAKALVAGYDFRFGYRGEGNAEKLQEACRKRGIPCKIVEKVELDGITVSSTAIRNFLSEGNMEQAARFLGHPYCLTDIVRHGYEIGRTMGFPTANLFYEPGVLVPRRGVYATRAILEDGRDYAAMTNIGHRPTFHGERDTVEANLLNFSGDLYGQQMRLELLHFIRPEMKFSSPEELRRQMQADELQVQQYFETNRNFGKPI